MFVNLLVLFQDTLVPTRLGLGLITCITQKRTVYNAILFWTTENIHTTVPLVSDDNTTISFSNTYKYRASPKIIYVLAFHQRCQCLIQASLTKSNKEEGNFLEYEVCIVIEGLIGIVDLVELEDKYDF